MTTGLSDFHKMVVTVLKTTFLKSKPMPNGDNLALRAVEFLIP